MTHHDDHPDRDEAGAAIPSGPALSGMHRHDGDPEPDDLAGEPPARTAPAHGADRGDGGSGTVAGDDPIKQQAPVLARDAEQDPDAGGDRQPGRSA